MKLAEKWTREDIWMYLVNRRNSDSSLPTRSCGPSLQQASQELVLFFRVSRGALSLSSSDDLVCRFCSLIIEQIRNEIEAERDA